MFNLSFQFQKKSSFFSVVFAGLLTLAAIFSSPSLAGADAGFSGVVTNLAGTPLSGIQVQLLDANGVSVAAPVTTGGDGSYTYGGTATGSGFPAGAYTVEFQKLDQSSTPAVFYNNKLLAADADTLTLTDGMVTPNVNAIIDGWGLIRGKVTNAAGAGIDGIQVSVCDANGAAIAALPAVTTKGGGNYVVGGIDPAKGPYKVRFNGNNLYTGQWYNNAAQASAAISVSVTAYLTTSVNQVLPASNISGTVTNTLGVPLPNIQVYLYDASLNFYPVGGVLTAADGSYSMTGITPGTYGVLFQDASGVYQKQYYSLKSSRPAPNITISAGAPLTGINATLGTGVPTVTSFSVPAFSKSLTVTGIVMTASEPINGIAGYLVTETPTTPATGAAWSATPPTTYTIVDPSIGTKTLYAWAKSKATPGIISASQSQTLAFDPTPPVLTVSTLSDGTSTDNAVLNVSGTATVTLSTISTLTVDGAPVVISPTDGSFSYPLSLKSGANSVTVIATDSTGLASTVTRTITLGSALPAFTISAPADNSTLQATSLDVTGTADATATVTVTANGVAAQSFSRTGADGTGFTATVNLSAGLNTIEVAVKDAVTGAINTLKRTVSSEPAQSLIAITDPAQDILIKLVSGAAGAYTLQGTASNPLSAVTVSVTANGTTTQPTLTAGAFSQPLTFPTAKIYPIVVTATDANNVVTTTQRNIIFAENYTGDMNGDGLVTVADALIALRMAVRLIPTTAADLLNGDVAPLVNGLPTQNGSVDVADALLILRKVVGLVHW